MERLLNIIHEDENLLVINKPADLVCHPTKGDAYSSLISRVRLYLGSSGEAHLINRLDRETRGVVLVAKSLACPTMRCTPAGFALHGAGRRSSSERRLNPGSLLSGRNLSWAEFSFGGRQNYLMAEISATGVSRFIHTCPRCSRPSVDLWERGRDRRFACARPPGQRACKCTHRWRAGPGPYYGSQSPSYNGL